MNGIYLHIPFCKSRCIYCGFYSTVCQQDRKEKYVQRLCQELQERQDFLPNREIDTIYIGGGTPSLLSEQQLHQIFQTIYSVYHVKPDAEVTLEVNPDDVTPSFVSFLRHLPVNRVSMGVQSFGEDVLHFLHRRHTTQQTVRAVDLLQKGGIQNISIDLIYGLPGQTMDVWRKDVEKALELPVQHLSSYSLMFEKETLLKQMQVKGQVQEVDEAVSLSMYEYLMDRLQEKGWEHYEISNFAQPGFRSRHNSGYWKGMAYLGCGASAHSFDGSNYRCWNVADVEKYITTTDIEKVQEHEVLTLENQINECIMTHLRTCEGIRLKDFADRFGAIQLQKLLDLAKNHLAEGNLEQTATTLKLTRRGLFVSDMIMSDLMEV